MKIALVHDFFTQWGGGERVLKYISDIFPDAPIYFIAKDQKLVDEFLPGRKTVTSFLQDYPGMPSNYRYYLPLMPKAIESFDFSSYDVVLSDSSSYSKGVVTKGSTRHVCYMHTPTRYLTSDKDEYIATAPIPLPLIGRPVVRAIANHLAKWDLKASKGPDYLIVNSEYIADRTRKYYKRNPDEVLFPPVDTKQFKLSDKVGDYWLVLARNEPYKRTDLAIMAANALGLKLKVAGGGTKLDELRALAGPTVEFVGRVSDSELADLYSNSIGLIFPPKEDAGMTPLESMASGRPVIAYGEGGALESVKAGVTGEFFADQTVDSLMSVLRKFNPKKYDPKKIREHSKQFDVERFKNRIEQIVKEQLKNEK